MPDFTDGYGLWVDLGTLTATNEWQTFRRPCQAGILFRFSFNIDWGLWDNNLGFKSWAWFRFAHHDDAGTFKNVESSFKLYPKKENMLMEKPILATLYNNPYTLRLASFRRVVNYKSRPNASAVGADGTIPIIPWQLKVEYLSDA